MGMSSPIILQVIRNLLASLNELGAEISAKLDKRKANKAKRSDADAE